MRKLTVIAAALAAGMASFAHAQEGVAQNPAKPASAAKDRAGAKAGSDKCQFLFSCNQVDVVGKKPGRAQKAAAASDREQAPTKAPRKARTAKATKNKAKVANAEPKVRKGRTRIVLKEDGKAVDLVTTAAIVQGDRAVAVKTIVADGAPFHAIVTRYATEYGVPVSLAHAVITVESNYRPNITGRAGEIGLMQIKPATARMMGYAGSAKGLYNPETNIKFGMKYLAKARELGGGTTCGTILKYNAGHGATRMNPVSSAYCSKVKRHLGA